MSANPYRLLTDTLSIWLMMTDKQAKQMAEIGRVIILFRALVLNIAQAIFSCLGLTQKSCNLDSWGLQNPRIFFSEKVGAVNCSGVGCGVRLKSGQCCYDGASTVTMGRGNGLLAGERMG